MRFAPQQGEDNKRGSAPLSGVQCRLLTLRTSVQGLSIQHTGKLCLGRVFTSWRFRPVQLVASETVANLNSAGQ
jgi:hypothetical protein